MGARIKRAILSVSDKTGIIELARFLAAEGVEILSTGGTAKHLSDAGIPVLQIAQWSGAPEVFGGRVKTLTPKVFGAILYDRDQPQHISEAESNGIPPVDLVVVNLYPFESTIARGNVSIPEAIEQIDVGGPSMLRAAAKNHRHVVPLCDPSLYEPFITEMSSGSISEEFRLRAAIEVFRKTATYDAAIAAFLASHGEPRGTLDSLHLVLRKAQDLRYGENPQQSAAFYTASGEPPFQQLQGKELSYNNINDLDAAWKVAASFTKPSCAIIKHTNPCGVGEAESVAEALRIALESDPVSAFGGVIGVNAEFGLDAAHLVESIFLEVIVAPSFSEEALQVLSSKKNLRLVAASNLQLPVELRTAAGGYLLQSADAISSPESWRVVTRIHPTPEQLEALRFAWSVCAQVKSNAIVLARKGQSVGIGAGQMSRVDSAKLAIMKSILPTLGTVAASDAFFPFRDGLDVLIDAGVTAIVQPGGSVRDEEVIAAADERAISMIFTGERHFRH